MTTVYLTKRAGFSASHFYWRDDWSPAKNEACFGLCSNRYGHGHNYRVYATFAGQIDPQTGMVVNLKNLKAILNSVVGDQLEHRHLNHQVDYFKTHVPTLENIAVYLWQELTPLVHDLPCRLDSLRVVENADLFVEYYGEKGAPP